MPRKTHTQQRKARKSAPMPKPGSIYGNVTDSILMFLVADEVPTTTHEPKASRVVAESTVAVKPVSQPKAADAQPEAKPRTLYRYHVQYFTSARSKAPRTVKTLYRFKRKAENRAERLRSRGLRAEVVRVKITK